MHDQRGRRCLISQMRTKSRLGLCVASRGEKSVRGFRAAYLVYVMDGFAYDDCSVRNADQGIEKAVYGAG